MALTIGSAGSAAERRQAMRMHTVGLVAGALTSALGLTAIGVALAAAVDTGSPVVMGAVAALAAGWALETASGHGLPFPRSRWQVPERWRYDLPFPFTLGAYGYLLGLGFLTNTVSAGFWLFVVTTLLVPHLAVTVPAWLLYAAMRGIATARGTARVAACPLEPPSDIYSRAGLGLLRWTNTALLVCASALALQ